MRTVSVFFRKLLREIAADQLSYAAAAVAFYAWMSIFPLLLAAVSGFGVWLGTAGARERVLDGLQQNLPVVRVLEASGIDLENLLSSVTAISGPAGFLGLAGLLWTGMQVVLALQVALNRVFGVETRPGWFAARGRALLFVLIAAVLMAVSFGTTFAVSLLPTGMVARLAGWVLGLVLMGLMFGAAYRVLTRLDLPWAYALSGGMVTALLWYAANVALVWYFANVANFQAVYGSFGGVVIVLLTCYYLAFVTLIGAEVTHVSLGLFATRPEKEQAATPLA
jgi:membrane protein